MRDIDELIKTVGEYISEIALIAERLIDTLKGFRTTAYVYNEHKSVSVVNTGRVVSHYRLRELMRPP